MTASVGTLVAAAFETVGYRAQGEVLLKLGGMVHQLGALIFLLAAIAAILSIGMYGSYSLGKWLIIGPGIFYFLVFTTVSSSGAEWQFGNDMPAQREGGGSNTDDLNRMVGGLKSVKVSKPFDWYNQLVSHLSRSLISVITNRKSAIQQIKFTARPKLMHGILGAQLTNPGLIALLEIGLKAECSNAMGDMRTIAYGRRDSSFRLSPEYTAAVSRYEDEFLKQTFSIEPDGTVYNYLVNQLRAVKQAGKEREYLDKYCEAKTYPDLYADFNISPDAASSASQGFFSGVSQYFSGLLGSGTSVQNFSPEILLNRGVNCQRLWCWAAMGLDQEAQDIQKQVSAGVVLDTATVELKQLIASEVSNKFQKPAMDLTDGESDSIDTSTIPAVIVGVLLRKAFNGDYLSDLQTNYARHMGVKTVDYALSSSNYQENAEDISKRYAQHVQAESLLYEYFTLGMSLPYLQGLFLYGLALLYPFFCLLVLIPGRAAGIFNWMALWAWVKSWDVGFAIAMVADDTIWKLMPHRSMINTSTDSSFSPLTILESAFRPDPAYSLSGYYMIMGMIMTAVPVYCGNVVFGTKKAISGKLFEGFSTLSARVGRYGAGNAQSRQTMPLEKARDMALARHTQEMAQKLMNARKNEGIATGAIDVASGILGKAGMLVAGPLGLASRAFDSIESFGNGLATGSASKGMLGYITSPLGNAVGFVGGLGAGLTHGITRVGVAAWQNGLEQQRQGVAYRLTLMANQNAVETYKYWKGDEMMMIEGLRTVASGRGEFFNQPSPPSNSMQMFDKAAIRYNNSWIGNLTKTLSVGVGAWLDWRKPKK